MQQERKNIKSSQGNRQKVMKRYTRIIHTSQTTRQANKRIVQKKRIRSRLKRNKFTLESATLRTHETKYLDNFTNYYFNDHSHKLRRQSSQSSRGKFQTQGNGLVNVMKINLVRMKYKRKIMELRLKQISQNNYMKQLISRRPKQQNE